jgi:hypothetical protein
VEEDVTENDLSKERKPDEFLSHASDNLIYSQFDEWLSIACAVMI